MVWMDTAPFAEDEKRRHIEADVELRLTYFEAQCDQWEAAIRDARRKDAGNELADEWGYNLCGVGCAPARELTDQEAG